MGRLLLVCCGIAALALGCDGGGELGPDGSTPPPRDAGSVDAHNPLTDPETGPPAGNPEGDAFALLERHHGGVAVLHPRQEPAQEHEVLLVVLDRLEPSETGGFFDYKGETIEW